MNRAVLRAMVGVLLLSAAASAQTIRLESVSVTLRGPVFSSQKASNWCWAATISNLFAHYGHGVSQSRIVTEAYGAPVNMTGGDYSNLARLLNRPWVDDSGGGFNSKLVAALDVPNGVTAISNDQIRDALARNRPLVIGTTSHAMLAIGMTYTEIGGSVVNVSQVQVFDPWPGVGFRNARMEEVTPAPRGGILLFVAEARVSASKSDASRSLPSSLPSPMGRSCQTQIGRCGPFYNQPALPVGTNCYCATPSGPVAGVVVQP